MLVFAFVALDRRVRPPRRTDVAYPLLILALLAVYWRLGRAA